MALRKIDLKNALETEVITVGSELRQKDNSFLCADVTEMLDRCWTKKYAFVGYCNNSKYAEQNGVILVLNVNNNKFWVHVPKGMFGCWCTQVGINWQKHPVYEKLFEEMYEEEKQHGKKRTDAR